MYLLRSWYASKQSSARPSNRSSDQSNDRAIERSSDQSSKKRPVQQKQLLGKSVQPRISNLAGKFENLVGFLEPGRVLSERPRSDVRECRTSRCESEHEYGYCPLAKNQETTWQNEPGNRVLAKSRATAKISKPSKVFLPSKRSDWDACTMTIVHACAMIIVHACTSKSVKSSGIGLSRKDIDWQHVPLAF